MEFTKKGVSQSDGYLFNQSVIPQGIESEHVWPKSNAKSWE